MSGVRAAVAWVGWDARLIPDTALYAQGGLGLYPSPLGRLFGAAGEGGLALVSVGSAALLPLLVAGLARRVGGSPGLAALVAVVTPLSLWTIFVGVDAPATALLLASALALLDGRRGWAAVSAVAAVATHAAVAPLVLFAGQQISGLGKPVRVLAVAAVAGLSSALVVWTPYRALLSGLSDPLASLRYGFVVLLIAALPYLLALRRLLRASELRPLLLACAAGTVVSAGVVGAVEGVPSARYGLPFSMLAAVVVSRPKEVPG